MRYESGTLFCYRISSSLSLGFLRVACLSEERAFFFLSVALHRICLLNGLIWFAAVLLVFWLGEMGRWYTNITVFSQSQPMPALGGFFVLLPNVLHSEENGKPLK